MKRENAAKQPSIAIIEGVARLGFGMVSGLPEARLTIS